MSLPRLHGLQVVLEVASADSVAAVLAERECGQCAGADRATDGDFVDAEFVGCLSDAQELRAFAFVLWP